MKKLAVSLIVVASLAITPSVFALTSMSADNMKAATAQAGVSIAIDNVQIESFVGATTYTDADGTSNPYAAPTPGESGSITISNRHTVKNYKALTSNADFQAKFSAASGVAAQGVWAVASALSIDVGTCPVLSKGLADNPALPAGMTVTGVVIGLPTLMITTSSDSYSVTASNTLASTANNGKAFIQISTTGSTMAILGGTLEIAPH